MSHLINDEAVYRTAPATPGLLIRLTMIYGMCISINAIVEWAGGRSVVNGNTVRVRVD